MKKVLRENSKWDMEIKQQIKECSKEIREMKKHMPYIFVEHNNMIHAKEKLERAQREYDEAKRIWEQLGNKDNI